MSTVISSQSEGLSFNNGLAVEGTLNTNILTVGGTSTFNDLVTAQKGLSVTGTSDTDVLSVIGKSKFNELLTAEKQLLVKGSSTFKN